MLRAAFRIFLTYLTFSVVFFIPPAFGEGQWILSSVDENIDYGKSNDLYTTDIHTRIGEIQIIKDHEGTEGYEPYVQKSIMTWTPMPAIMLPGETVYVGLTVADGGSTAGYRNTGILSLSQVGERDYDFIASKYRGLEQTIQYTVPYAVEGDELLLKIEGSMGTRLLPSAVYIYTYTFTGDECPKVPIIDASGEVTLNTGDVVVPIAPGTVISSGDVLVSGPDGTVSVMFQGDGDTLLDSNSAVGIIDDDSIVMFMGRTYLNTSAPFEIYLSGTDVDSEDEYLIYRLKSSMDDLSESIESQDDASVVRNSGSEYTVSFRDGWDIEVTVLSGSVVFETKGREVTVREGETMRTRIDGNPQIFPAASTDEWWKPSADSVPEEEKGIPGFGLVIGAAAMAAAFMFLRIGNRP